MRYSTIAEKNDETLLEIIDMLEQFEKDKFIAGLQMRHYSQFQIEQTLDMVRYATILLDISDESQEDFDELLLERSPKGGYWLHFAVRPSGNRRKVRFLQT